MLEVPQWILTKMQAQKRVITLKGKLMKIITNRDRTQRLKRKRESAQKEEFAQQFIDDKVWFPPDDVTTTVSQPVDKK